MRFIKVAGEFLSILNERTPFLDKLTLGIGAGVVATPSLGLYDTVFPFISTMLGWGVAIVTIWLGVVRLQVASEDLRDRRKKKDEKQK